MEELYEVALLAIASAWFGVTLDDYINKRTGISPFIVALITLIIAATVALVAIGF